MTSIPDLSQLDPDQQIKRNLIARPDLRPGVLLPPVVPPPPSTQGVQGSQMPDPAPPVVAQPNISPAQSRVDYLRSQPSGISGLHPKSTIGKIGKGALQGLDFLGSTLAPGIAANIPGTTLHHNVLEAQAERQLGSDVANQQKEAQTNAVNAEAQTAQQREAETERHNRADEQNAADKLKAPSPAKAPHVTYDSGIPVSVSDGQGNVFDVNDPNLPPQLKPLVDAANRAHGQRVTEQQQAEDRRAKAAQDSQNRVFSHQEQMERERFAQQGKSQQDRENQLTSTTRTMVEAAPKVLSLANRINQLIDQQAKQLGPSASRWAEFMAGKVGAPNPQFTQLRTDVGLLTTLLMRMHVGARGGEYIMKHFQDLIDSGKQSPENLKAALGEIVQYANDVAAEGKGGAAANQQGPQPGAIEGGYRFKGGDPSKQENWEKAQ